MAAKWALYCVLLLVLVLVVGGVLAAKEGDVDHDRKGKGAVGAATKCREEDIKIRQWQVTRGLHPRWKVEVSSVCEACEASVVELQCPGWVEGKAIEGYMYPVELLSPGLCMVGASITPEKPFSTVYHQPAGQIQMSVASVRFTCPAP